MSNYTRIGMKQSGSNFNYKNKELNITCLHYSTRIWLMTNFIFIIGGTLINIIKSTESSLLAFFLHLIQHLSVSIFTLPAWGGLIAILIYISKRNLDSITKKTILKISLLLYGLCLPIGMFSFKPIFHGNDYSFHEAFKHNSGYIVMAISLYLILLSLIILTLNLPKFSNEKIEEDNWS